MSTLRIESGSGARASLRPVRTHISLCLALVLIGLCANPVFAAPGQKAVIALSALKLLEPTARLAAWRCGTRRANPSAK
jgi:hypothetical protein